MTNDEMFRTLIDKLESFGVEPYNSRCTLDQLVKEGKVFEVEVSNGFHQGDTGNAMRNWCQDSFGNNWIWSWNCYFFKTGGDALLFRLKYAAHLERDQ